MFTVTMELLKDIILKYQLSWKLSWNFQIILRHTVKSEEKMKWAKV